MKIKSKISSNQHRAELRRKITQAKWAYVVAQADLLILDFGLSLNQCAQDLNVAASQLSVHMRKIHEQTPSK